MKLKKINITNVKSFNSLFEVDFSDNFNIIVGPNASGKSNLLDIITVSIRKYFLHSYVQDDPGDVTSNIHKHQPFQGIDEFQKYLDNSADSIIEITFSIQDADLNNLELMEKLNDQFLHFAESKNINVNRRVHEEGWKQELFNEGEDVAYRIINNNLDISHHMSGNIQNDKPVIFLEYLNCYELFSIFCLEENIQLNPIFLFLSPYRANTGRYDFQGNLSSASAKSVFASLSNATSKSSTSLINMASLYFAEKMRRFESESLHGGYMEKWEKDNENRLVTSYLAKMGYQWNLKLKNANQNIYEIEIIKDGIHLSLSQASSGEKEIINYLFGIFALKIQNGMIIIDEPELHLHPRWQRLLLDLFLELSESTGNQFIITTHSPIFIQEKTLSKLIRVFKKDNESRHISLEESIGTNFKDLLHIINTTNNEKIFFADAVVLVEGITDRLIFQKLVQSELDKRNLLNVIEVVDINGKNNISKFRDFLNKLEVPNYFIADLDYVTNIGDHTINELFDLDKKSLDRNVFKNKYSLDKKKLIDVLDEAIEEGDLAALKDFVKYIKSFRLTLKDNLTTEQTEILNTFIKEQKFNGNFILAKGDIEDYFPKEFNAKDLDNVLILLSTEGLGNWYQSNKEGIEKLEEIVSEIVETTIYNN